MRIYIAGPFTNGAWREVQATVRSYPHILESFHYIGKQGMVDNIRAEKRQVFLDSGAFSAFTLGVKISIEEYASYIRRNRDIIEFASNLDAITNDKEEAARLTWENQKRLEELAGKETYIIPVYHMREPVAALQRLIDNYPFIALGGMVPESTKDLSVLLDELWDRFLTHPDGSPRVRVHGFGLTTFDLMLRYPWWSVDSTSWVMSGAFGSVRVMNSEGKPLTIAISGQSPKRKDMGAHFDSLSAVEQREIVRLIEAKGFTLEQLRGPGSAGMLARGAFNIEFHRDLMGRNAKSFKKAQEGFF